jgi:hypothetical protein
VYVEISSMTTLLLAPNAQFTLCLVVQLSDSSCFVIHGGKPSTKEAKLAHSAAKPDFRAMLTRFKTNLLVLQYWQGELLTALVEVK